MPATLIYDGQCPFCVKSARRLQALVGAGRLSILPLDSPAAMALHPDLSYSRALGAVQLVLENGALCEGAEAACSALALRPGLGFIRLVYYLPLLRQIFDLAYKISGLRRRRCAGCP
jgi:acetyl esterase